MRKATSVDKFMSSIINAIVVFLFFLPVLIFFDFSILVKKIIFIVFMVIYRILFIVINENRSIGMILMGTYWEKRYPLSKQILHAILYTVSFSTLLFWIFFPFDLFLINLLLFQLLSMKLTGMTLQEYLSGGMQGVKK